MTKKTFQPATADGGDLRTLLGGIVLAVELARQGQHAGLAPETRRRRYLAALQVADEYLAVVADPDVELVQAVVTQLRPRPASQQDGESGPGAA